MLTARNRDLFEEGLPQRFHRPPLLCRNQGGKLQYQGGAGGAWAASLSGWSRCHFKYTR